MKRLSHPLFPDQKAGLFIIVVLALIISACNVGTTPIPSVETTEVDTPIVETSTESPEEENVPDAFTPVEFTDYLDRDVIIDSQPARVVSLAPSVTESLFTIGAGPLVVGRTDYCNYPEEANDLPSIGGFAASSISIESILDLEPDIVIGGSTQQAEIITTLEEAGIPTFVVQPESILEIQEALLLMGNITGHAAEAQTIVDDMQNRIDKVTDVVAKIPQEERVKVFYEVWHEPLMTTTRKTFIGEAIELAGGINIFGDLDEQYPTISAEQIIASDPQVIVGPSSHGDQLTVEIISQREGWQNIIAVKNDAIYILDGDIVSRAAPRVIDALEELAVIFYPESFDE